MRQLVFIILMILLPGQSFSQTPDTKETTYWVDAGLGLAHNSFAFGVGVNYALDNTLYKFRFNVCEEFILFGPSPTEISFSPGFMYGKLISDRFFRLQISGGLGFTWGTQRGELLYAKPGTGGWIDFGDRRVYASDRFITPSIPVEAEITLKPLRFFSISASLFGDVNLKMPTYGVLFRVGVGKLR